MTPSPAARAEALEVPIPACVYYLPDADNFYDARWQVGMGHGFWRYWRGSRDRFPQSREAALVAALDAQARLIEEARETLGRYRYAAQWAGADAWDFCGECQARIKWAREKDVVHLTTNEVAAVGASFLHDEALTTLPAKAGGAK